ncbi:hypothetical protein B0H14DRAFT_2612668 [Mycena olivaceomarginata]|nr:hypothetical protein B0H14DRAFT_2612668 [Mycena olivaceomarginata]
MSRPSPTTEGPLNGSTNSISQFGPNEKEKGSSSGSQTAPETADDFPHGFKLVVLMVALCLAVFLVALDNSIIATAIPKITEQFRSLDDVGWLTGRYSTEALFLTAISLFELGSLICGVAPNSKALIIGRAIAGLGSAGIFNGALIIIGQFTGKGTSAVKSGIDNLPTLLSCVLSMTLCGVLVTTFGYYTQFFWLCTVVMTIGAGLISTFKPDTGHALWIGYQVIYGFGVGCGMGAPLMVAQTILELKDVPGGSLFISVAQNVFQNKLISSLASRVPELPPALIFAAGATNLKTAVDPKFLTARFKLAVREGVELSLMLCESRTKQNKNFTPALSRRMRMGRGKELMVYGANLNEDDRMAGFQDIHHGL